MKRCRFGRRVTRVVMRLVDVFEASFRQIFGGFLNTEGFCRVFISGLGGFCLIHIPNRKISLGKRLGFLSSYFPVSSPPFLSFFFFILCCILRVCFSQSGVVKFVV